MTDPTKIPQHDARHIDYPQFASGTVVLVSGGVDSLINADSHPDALCLFVHMGQPEAESEWHACRKLYGDRLLVARLSAPGLDASDGKFVPARNMLLCCLAAQVGDHIVLGAMKDDHSLDKTQSAIRDMQTLLCLQAGRNVHVETPLAHLMKYDAVTRYCIRAGGKERMSQTWSCYGTRADRCMDCKACARWVVAMRYNGIVTEKLSDRMTTWALGRQAVLDPEEAAAVRMVLS